VLPFIFRRILQFVPTFLLGTVLIFAIVQLAPGDFTSTLRENPLIKPEQRQLLIERYGLDKPVVTQYFSWLARFVQGDLGTSFAENRPVWEVIAPRVSNSLILVLLSTIIATAVAIPLGIFSALKPYSFPDRVFSVLTYFGLGIPSFFFMLLVMYGMVKLKQNFGWEVPISGKSSGNFTGWRYALDVFVFALPPSIVIALRSISSDSRFIRGQMLEVLGQDYIRTAKAKGLGMNKMVYKHAFRNAVIPQVAGIGGLLPGIISGAGFVEVTYSWPGLTPKLLEVLTSKDLYIFVSVTALSVLLYIVGNIISDILLGLVDPRIRYN